MKVSVITVVYNNAETIEGAIKSVAEQDYTDIEHIVVDGGSNDGTLEIIEKYRGRLGKVVTEPDEGIYDAMNKGLALATGEIIGFLNSDDLYADSSVVKQVVNAFQDGTVDACYADLVYVTKDNEKVIRYWKSSSFKKGDFTLGWCPHHPTFYVRKSIVEQLGGFDQSVRIAADVELMMRYLERGGIRTRYIPRVWVTMRVGGKTNQSLKNIFHQNKEVLRALRRNNIHVSTFLFVVRKIINRIGQYVLGFLRNFRQCKDTKW